ncbi:type VI secretion system-associated protein TagF [Paraburkholderia edwinii]|uniref:Type VI secretion system-associated protein TagF n=1 Tax=Paraburkholderia edwinii TaxID=2861782 RepID=A0ABX8UQV1_9BURK|nr:type VI secretion system-associated protein TagF [Paraburkholderia edwinii]QYD71376.1 type VI secretion system-associated protein TagF [Paraburkholderia edwinii]
MSGALGFYGKLPGAGDFVGRRLPSGFVDIWDRHFEQAIDTARTALSAQWTAAYRDGPAWRFVLPAHVCGESAWCGLIGPAEDRVGRGFPLVLAAPCSGGCAGLFADGDWFDALERVFVGAQYEALGVEAFDARVAALPPPCAHANDARPWWRDLDWDSAQWRLPSPQDVAAGLLLDAAWQQLATRPGSWCLWWTRRAERVLATRGLPASYASLLEPRDEQDLASLLEPGGAHDIASLLEPGGAQEYASQPELRGAQRHASPSESGGMHGYASQPELRAAQHHASPPESRGMHGYVSQPELRAAQRHASQPESRGMHDHASPPDVRGPRPAATSPTLPASTGDRHDSSNPLGAAASPSDPNAPTVSRVSARLGEGRERVEWPSAHSARDVAATTVRDAAHGDVSRGRTGAQTSERPNASSSVQPGAFPELSASLADAALLSLDHGRTLLVSADDGPPDPRRRAAQRIRAAALASAPDLASLRATLLALHAPLRAAAEDALNPVHEEGAALAARFEAGRIHLLRIGTAAAWHWRHGVLTPLFVERAAGVGGELDDLLFGDAWLAMPGLGSMTGPHCDETGAAFEPGDRLLLVATRNLTQLAPEVFAEALGLPSCEDARMHIATRVGLHATPATSAMAALSARSAVSARSATPAQWPLAIIEERA